MSLTFSMQANLVTARSPVTAVCDLPERCSNGEQLKGHLTEKKYYRIDLRGNALCDEDLHALFTLSYIEALNLTDTEITGSCLTKILNIPGLKYLNLAGNDSLDLKLTVKALTADYPYSQLKVLNLSGIRFDVYQLIDIINHAFKIANKNLDRLILGELKHLENNQLSFLYNVIQTLPNMHSQCVIIESSAIKQVEENHLLLIQDVAIHSNRPSRMRHYCR